MTKQDRQPSVSSRTVIIVFFLFAAANLSLYTGLPSLTFLRALKKYDAGVSASIIPSGGTSQVTPVNTMFATALQATVKDSAGNPVRDLNVMFSAPESGASATFDGSTTAVRATDSNGIAFAPPLIANGQAGSYAVIASVNGAGETAAFFSLMNTSTEPETVSDTSTSRGEVRRVLLALDGFGLLAGGLYFICAGWLGSDRNTRLFTAAITIGCSLAIFIVLATFGRDAHFAPLSTLMTNPSSLPVYGQRLLVVWLADMLKVIFPPFSYRRCYLATQLVMILGATFVMGKWSAFFVGERLKCVGQLLLAIILIPTITYTNFYDVPMVLVYTLCLWFLYKKLYTWFIIVLGIGTINHENTLLLVIVAAFVLWDMKSPRISFGVPLAALAVWLAARLTMQLAIPATSHFELHLFTNLKMLAHPSAELIKSFGHLFFWLVCAAAGYRRANQFVRRAAILFPALVAVTLVAGRFVEARQFDAFIPVAIALILPMFRDGEVSNVEGEFEPAE